MLALRGPRPDGRSREAEVLRLVTKGCTNLEIAAKLAISVHIVERHRTDGWI
jgi:DNA-binding CsgD family transcriptional regulator